MTIIVYVQVANVALTLQEAAKCMKPDSASVEIELKFKHFKIVVQI